VEAGVDFFKVQTLPGFAEALEIAEASQSTGLPYVLSFVIRRDGCILDSTPLDPAMNTIDAEAPRPPESCAVNRVHASVFTAASCTVRERDPSTAEGWLGMDADTSSKTPEELDGLAEIDSEAPDDFGENAAAPHERSGIANLGGCCGSSTEPVATLAGHPAPPAEPGQGGYSQALTSS